MTTAIENTFLFCPRCGASHPHPGKIPFRCPKCEFTLFFGPVAAVGGLVVDDHERLLLVRRARDPGKGLWGLPGGFVDAGETIEEALSREIDEETELQITATELLMTFPNQYNYKGVVSQVIDLFYICRVADSSKVTLEPSELDDFVWTVPGADYLDEMAFDSNRRAVQRWLEQRGTA
ncbi:NUDIX hydrolase [Roseiconus lacunae]|uniref:NUDIX domain-containing protein n=1 Tax=Roseiconus lacunae TaxID=2605694 RepID=A0ABT7PDL1_9BACT|nr:NUDIX domain-containing protein [Roseiconus lacunae]MCD0459726.1 NUDIX domain-containing protein [Roseiconus lacunae]MDM4014423.1 NUDIX domain-containing protein [Roseiconus lacunae]